MTSPSGEFFIGSSGQRFNIYTRADLSESGISVALEFLKPDNNIQSVAGTVTSPPDKGVFRVTIPVGLFDQEGEYRLQPVITLVGGDVIPGETATIDVKKRFSL